MANKPKDTRTAEQIRRDLDAARSRVASTIEDATEQFHPKTLKNDAVNGAKAFAQTEFDQAKSQVKDDDGWRIDRIVIAGGALVAGIVALATLRAIVGRATGQTARRKLEKVQLAEARAAAKQAKALRKVEAKLVKRSRRKGGGALIDLAHDDAKVSGLAQAMLKQAATLRAEAASERAQGV
ncbi:DUF3618 domain-containing protein [Acidipropionibacterium timonense]|uniref:DUF3618 domain-containing protein n=1 Tax=Acidipropionibacterium timonense TaxID=2161818 RepID=UPI0010313CB2|nr:DUF3618 domain-containing protein [Acidipropionibacterium timonense]